MTLLDIVGLAFLALCISVIIWICCQRAQEPDPISIGLDPVELTNTWK